MTTLTRKIHSIDQLDHPFGIYITPYIVEEEGPRDLTLVDTCFTAELPKLIKHVEDEGYDIKNVKRLILTHTHPDHVQAANEVRRITGAKIFAHWLDAGFLKHDPPYHGPPTHQLIGQMLDRLGISEEQVTKKYGSLARDAVQVDYELNEGDRVGRLKVVHTPGHTPGHICLYSEEDSALIGADVLFAGLFGNEGLFVLQDVSIDPKIGILSAKRISKLKFDKLLLAHQRAPLIDRGAPEAAARAYTTSLLDEKSTKS
ncbi:MAG TPA: MBL fold metallo-hydrolase [Nitrososphaerales archaeon]|nr:MBL fold metallo-hydrolase [Nitrososphaerales archaeon]